MTKQRLELTWYNKDMALIPTEVGKYGYTWVDPSDPRYCETHTLVMDEYVQGTQSPKSDGFEYSERSALTPQDDNLLILGESGDVLEALTRVPELADKYVGKVKLIYIDPPFNTQQAFSSYDDALEHSVWLTMMRDRLLHMRTLLSDDGSIWVHLDDVQVHRMRLLLDEVFGATNFVAEVIWQKANSPRNDGKGLSVDQDIILVYGKSSQPQINRLPRLSSRNELYQAPDGDPYRWISGDPAAPHSVNSQGIQVPAVFGVQNPVTGELIFPAKNRQWAKRRDVFQQWLHETAEYEDCEPDLEARARATGLRIEQLRVDIPDLRVKGGLFRLDENETLYAGRPLPRLYFTSGGRGGLKIKKYLHEISDTRIAQTLWLHSEVGHSRTAKNEMNLLFPQIAAFATPKPERLLERVIQIATDPGDIVVDMFAGSGTTAAVAQKMGRRWVTCELLEDTFNTFTRPRLEKVINDQDPGGITRTKGERVAADDVELPEGVSPDDAAKFTSVLNKLISDDPDLKKSPLVKALKATTKTKSTKEVINWRGGGGFQVAHLSPACFDVDEELGKVVLTEAATGQTLIESVAANLGFHLLHPDDDVVFEGRKGRTLLKVHEGIVDEDNALTWLGELQDGESLVIAALGVADGVNRALRRFGKGCRAIVIPDDLFRFDAGEES